MRRLAHNLSNEQKDRDLRHPGRGLYDVAHGTASWRASRGV